MAVACEDRVLRVFRVEDVSTRHFNFKRRELARDLVDVAFGTGGDLFVLSKVCRIATGLFTDLSPGCQGLGFVEMRNLLILWTCTWAAWFPKGE